MALLTFSFGCRNDAPIRKRKKPAAAAAREVIEKEVEFQKNEVAIEGRSEVMKEKRTGDIQPAHT